MAVRDTTIPLLGHSLVMGVAEQVEKGKPEGYRLEYTSKKASGYKLAKELVAMSNASGGTLVVGVQDDDHSCPDVLENIDSTDDIARSASDSINERVTPAIEFDTERVVVDGNTLLALSVENDEQLRSLEHESISEPVFPVRRQTETRYLTGTEVSEHFEEVISRRNNRNSNENLKLSDERIESEFDEYFIESPDGQISEICLFSDIHYPGNPARISLSADYISEQRAEHVFACLDEIFDLSIGDANFTLNQKNGAWIGRGFHNFVSNIRDRSQRYQAVLEDEYALELYGDEQGVLISDFGMVYPESTLLLYAAPFSHQDGYRHLTINILTEGMPIDTRPLLEFSERADLRLSTATSTEIKREGVKNPSRIPVETVERTTRGSSVDGELSVDGALCKNPFYGREDLLKRELDIERPAPIAKYRNLYAFLRNWDGTGSQREYDTQHFLVRDWNRYTERIPVNLMEVQFMINW